MKLLASFSFRLALLYATLFTLSVSILLALFYWISIRRPIEQVEASLAAESARFEMLYREQGAQALVVKLERRATLPAPRQAYHALIAPDGTVLATNLPSWPPEPNLRWLRIEADIYRDGEEYDHEALVLDRRLPDGARLMIGRDVQDIDDLDEGIRVGALWLMPVMALLVIAGGGLMSRAIGRRIDAVGATARRVMAGDLSERIPVRGSGDDIDRLGETLNAMLERIEASVESVRRVSDNVAHELRTPLTRLQAELNALQAASPERKAALIESANDEAERLGRMFDAVLRISRIEAQRHQPEMREVNISALIEDAADYHAPQAEERGLILDTQVERDLATVGDRDLLFQAVSNLIDNAIKFTPPGGRIALSASRADDGIALRVADTGPGIPSEHREKVIERFFRAPAAEPVPGFGLGLSLVAAVAKLHGSSLRFGDAAPGLAVEWTLPARSG
ncbi:MAG: HAMP domain-containing histidine kinase [Sphingomonas sp.]|nr:HAMP domain-containing histidine kinase [Sphingomonas sp.]